MKPSARVLLFAFAAFLCSSSINTAAAHPLAPSLLRIVEGSDGTAEVRFRMPLMRQVGRPIAPRFPDGCEVVEGPALELVREGSAVEQVARIACPAGLVGQRFGVDGLAEAGTDVLVQVELRDGTSVRGLIHGAERFVVPAREPTAEVVRGYFALGVEHLLSGADHVLFVLSLLFVVHGRRRLVLAVTAFTLGHSLSLVLSALGIVRVPSAPVEVAIAASLMVMALEILAQRRTGRVGAIGRRPGLVCAAFGLLHGLGFAGALLESGLPSDDVPLALASFNVGIEVGQLVVLAGGMLLAKAVKRLVPPRVVPGPIAAAYVTGSLAALFILDRVMAWALLG